MKELLQLRKAEETIRIWNDGLKAIGSTADEMDVLEVEWSDNGQCTWKAKRKEIPRVARETKTAG
jgi:hypothetical protein